MFFSIVNLQCLSSKTSVDISRKIVELQNKIKDTYGSENYVPEMFKIRD